MDNIGVIIKFNRISKGINQTKLAQGICSISYLSKIENGTARGNKEVIEHLFARLGITYDPQKDSNKYKEVKLLLAAIYKDITLKKNATYSSEQLEILLKRQHEYYPDFITWLLVVSRLYISLNDQKNAEFYLSFITDKDDNITTGLTDEQVYYYWKFKGLIEYLKGNSVPALQFIQKAMLDDKARSFGEWEEADMHYIISLGYLKDENLIECIRYIKKALDYFEKVSPIKRLIESIIVLGIAYKKSHMYEESEETYKRALELCNQINADDFKGMILHNLGNLSQNPKDSIEYYIKSLPYSSSLLHRLVTYFAMIKVFYIEKDHINVVHWANIGLNEISSLSKDKENTMLSFYYHLEIYKSLSTEGFVTEKLGNAAIQHFENIKGYKHCIHYCKLIGDYYMDLGKYKLAAQYLKKATEFVLLDKKLNSWEELDA